MQFECAHCHKTLNLPDAKLPVGRPFSFTCPHCKQKNSALIPPAASATPETLPAAELTQPPTDVPQAPAPDQAADQAMDRRQTDRRLGDRRQGAADQPPRPGPEAYPGPDDNLQSLNLAENDDIPKGLVVYDDEQISETLAAKLKALGFEATVAVNLRDAAKHLKFASFNVVLIQEDYYGASLVSNHLLRSLQNIDSQVRRGMRVVLISPTMTTLDDLLAFSLSFDAVVNKADLDTIDRILMSILARAKKFYAVYREILTEHGFD